MTTGEMNAVDFDVTFTDGSVHRVTACKRQSDSLLWWTHHSSGLSPEQAASRWASYMVSFVFQSLHVADIRRVSPTTAQVEATEKRLAALELFVAEFAHGTGWPRASELGNYGDVMQRATAEREARLGIAGYGRNPATDFFVLESATDTDWLRATESANHVDATRREKARLEVADAAAEVLGGTVRVRTVNVGVSSGGSWSIEDAEEAIHAATWGRPVTGYVVGLGREMVVVLKPVPRCL